MSDWTDETRARLEQLARWVGISGLDRTECAHNNVSRGRIYDFCEDCGAVRRAPTGATVVEPWHSCHACRITR